MRRSGTGSRRWTLLLAATALALTAAGCSSAGAAKPAGFAVTITDSTPWDVQIRDCGGCGVEGDRIEGSPDGGSGGTQTRWQETRSGTLTYSFAVHGANVTCPPTPERSMDGYLGELTSVDYTINKAGTCTMTPGYSSIAN